MMSNVPTYPKLSAAFDMDDINKLRQWEYDVSRTMSASEYARFINEAATKVLREIYTVSDDGINPAIQAEVLRRLHVTKE